MVKVNNNLKMEEQQQDSKVFGFLVMRADCYTRQIYNLSKGKQTVQNSLIVTKIEGKNLKAKKQLSTSQGALSK